MYVHIEELSRFQVELIRVLATQVYRVGGERQREGRTRRVIIIIIIRYVYRI